jgi:hypothetical protein
MRDERRLNSLIQCGSPATVPALLVSVAALGVSGFSMLSE